MGRDKATLPYEGTTLVERTVSIVRRRCSPVFVIAAPGQPLPPLEAEVLRDEARGVAAERPSQGLAEPHRRHARAMDAFAKALARDFDLG